MFVRMIALFPSIPFSVLTCSDNPNSSIQFSSIQGHHIGGGRGRGGGR
jgi:hypothetical protein